MHREAAKGHKAGQLNGEIVQKPFWSRWVTKQHKRWRRVRRPLCTCWSLVRAKWLETAWPQRDSSTGNTANGGHVWRYKHRCQTAAFLKLGNCEQFPTFRTILVPSSSGSCSLRRIFRTVYTKFFLNWLALNLKLLDPSKVPRDTRHTAADMTVQTVYQTAWTPALPSEFYSGTSNLTCEVRM